MRKTITVAILAATLSVLLLAGCQQRQEPGTSELAADLAKVTAERDQARAELAETRDIAEQLAPLAVKDRGSCTISVQVMQANLEDARAHLKKQPASKEPGTGATALESVEQALNASGNATEYCAAWQP